MVGWLVANDLLESMKTAVTLSDTLRWCCVLPELPHNYGDVADPRGFGCVEDAIWWGVNNSDEVDFIACYHSEDSNCRFSWGVRDFFSLGIFSWKIRNFKMHFFKFDKCLKTTNKKPEMQISLAISRIFTYKLRRSHFII